VRVINSYQFAVNCFQIKDVGIYKWMRLLRRFAPRNDKKSITYIVKIYSC